MWMGSDITAVTGRVGERCAILSKAETPTVTLCEEVSEWQVMTLSLLFSRFS